MALRFHQPIENYFILKRLSDLASARMNQTTAFSFTYYFFISVSDVSYRDVVLPYAERMS